MLGAVRSIARVQPQLTQARTVYRMAGPPRGNMSFPEKMAHMVVLVGSWIAIPGWVLVNIRNYKGGS